ncbi:MAG: hypothetical protein R3A13_10435 [Bdellovibrionota bacterium]
MDQDFKVIEECSGDIRLSPLQIPSPEAILTNRIDITRHQEKTSEIEVEAMGRIYDFISRTISDAGQKVALIGYNSARFDIPFLRTSLIRNGINPYFNGQIIYRDLLHAVRKLSCIDPDFPRSSGSNQDQNKLSLRLETICKELSLLDGKQTHDSYDDVLITIKLAEALLKRCKLDVRTYEAYEAINFHQDKNSHPIIQSSIPNYDLQLAKLSIEKPLALLDADHRQSLWVDLNRYLEHPDRTAISWSGVNSSQLILAKNQDIPENLLKIRDQAIQDFSKVRISNFFPKSSCDIEQDIYRLDFNDIKILSDAIWNQGKEKLNSASTRDPKVVYIRHQLSRYDSSQALNKKNDALLKKYALYRYGGDALISKFDTGNKEQANRHRKLKDYLDSSVEILKSASKTDARLLKSLLSHLASSDIVRVAGDELGVSPSNINQVISDS